MKYCVNGPLVADFAALKPSRSANRSFVKRYSNPSLTPQAFSQSKPTTVVSSAPPGSVEVTVWFLLPVLVSPVELTPGLESPEHVAVGLNGNPELHRMGEEPIRFRLEGEGGGSGCYRGGAGARQLDLRRRAVHRADADLAYGA